MAEKSLSTETLAQGAPASVVSETIYGPGWEVGAILFSTFIATIIAIATIWTHRRIARTRLAFESFSRNIWDKDYMEARKQFISLREAGKDDLAKWATVTHDSSQEVSVIRSILNDYEIMAIGIENGILDESFYFKAIRDALIRDWSVSESYVISMRKRLGNDRLFIKIEMLANRWEKRKPESL